MYTYYIVVTYLVNSRLIITTSFREEIIERMPGSGLVCIITYWERLGCPVTNFESIISGFVEIAEIQLDKTTFQSFPITCEYHLISRIDQLKFCIRHILQQ